MNSKKILLVVFAFSMLLMTGHASGQSDSTDDENSPAETVDEPTERIENEPADAESAQASPIRVIADPELARVEEADEEEDEEELICRRTQVTGTHRRVRRCFTRSELDAQREDAQDFLRDRVIQTNDDNGSL